MELGKTIKVRCEHFDGTSYTKTGNFNGYFNKALNLVCCKVNDFGREVNFIGEIISE